MEHACYKCGANVEDGTPFCPHCGAPQIRVAGLGEAGTGAPAERGEQPATPPLVPGTPGEVQPPAEPLMFSRGAPGVEADPRVIIWPKAIPGAILAAILVALFAGLLPLPPVFVFFWTILGGALAVRLYGRRTQREIPARTGARLGAVTGAISFLLFAAITAVNVLVVGSAKLRQALVDAVQQSAAHNADPRAQELVQRMTSPEGLAVLVVISMVLFLLAFIVFSMAGGALAASLWGGGERR